MKTISRKNKLLEEIDYLKLQQEQELGALKYQFRVVQESLTPMNLLKNTFKGVTENTTTLGILEGAASLAGGYLSDKYLPTPVKKIGGSILRFLAKKLLPSKK